MSEKSRRGWRARRVSIRVAGWFRPPSDGVLDLLSRVRLGEDLPEEEFQEPGIVALPVGGVVLGPAAVTAEMFLEAAGIGHPRRGERRQRGGRTDENLSCHAFRAGGGQVQ
jgi:hypothetical protein